MKWLAEGPNQDNYEARFVYKPKYSRPLAKKIFGPDEFYLTRIRNHRGRRVRRKKPKMIWYRFAEVPFILNDDWIINIRGEDNDAV